jgi:hypothetical protein
MSKRKKRKGEWLNPRELLDGTRWVFLCFLPDRAEALKNMLVEVMQESGKGLQIGHTHFGPGVLWNGEEAHAFIVPKACLSREALFRGLRRHLGYECPNPTSDVFTLGVLPEDDEKLARTRLFARK